MIHIGLTGSIGMGKSTTAGLFAKEGVPVFDADAAVAAMYARGGEGVEAVEAAFPHVIRAGAVDRVALSAHLKDNPADFARLEAIVHPLVAARRAAFLDEAEKKGAWCVLFDIPLLFETGMDGRVDVIVVVSAPHTVQRERVLAREGMHPEKFEMILARQTPDAEKRERAHYVIDTSAGIEAAHDQVRAVLESLCKQIHTPSP